MRLIYIILLSSIISPIFGQSQAPDFPFITLNDSTQTLDELKGEVVYISFWASWCKPCLRNFEKYESMRLELQNRGVKLLNVNIDDNREIWKSTLLSKNILGTNVWASDFEQIQDDYEIYNIPQYEIVNKKGMLVYLSQNENRSIIEEFIGWLKESE